MSDVLFEVQNDLACKDSRKVFPFVTEVVNISMGIPFCLDKKRIADTSA